MARIGRSWHVGLRAHAPVITVLAVALLASTLLLGPEDQQVAFNAGGVAKNVFSILPHVLAAIGLFGIMALLCRRDRKSTLLRMLRQLRDQDWPEIALVRIPMVLVLLSVNGYVLLHFKVNIAQFGQYSWDHAFAAVDRLIFAGVDPWVLTHSVFGTPELTKLIDNLYLLWFFVQKFCVVYVALLPLQSELRQTFLLAYCLCWMIGGVAIAVTLPAAGPVYMQPITGDPTFRPLMDLLYQYSETIPIKALRIQEKLWQGFTDPGSVDPLGISAFPSLHVTIAVVFACFGFRLRGVLGWGLTLYAGIMLVGSVHLAWHYAIDGIAGIALALALWHVSRRVSVWWLARGDLAVAMPLAEPAWGAIPIRALAEQSSAAVQPAVELAKNRFSTSR